jgi:exopolyphosphatase/guanosine-5'-triphosphate,3'-diphosphate pyrophosphatase
MAQALSSNFGRDSLPDERLRQIVKSQQLQRAHCWGLAMRLGQRISGGVASVLDRTSLAVENGMLRLHVPSAEESLAGDAVRRRLDRLADVLEMKAEVAADL